MSEPTILVPCDVTVGHVGRHGIWFSLGAGRYHFDRHDNRLENIDDALATLHRAMSRVGAELLKEQGK